MTFNELLDLKNEHTRVDVLLGTLEEQNVLIPFLLHLKDFTVKVFASELVKDLTQLEEVGVTELKTFVFDNVQKAEEFYSELHDGKHIEQLIKVYLKNRRKLKS